MSSTSSPDDRDALMVALTDLREQQLGAIASRLHDGPIQVLTAMSLRLGLLRRGRPDDGGELAELERLAQVAVEALRREMEALRAPDEFSATASEAIASLLTRTGLSKELDVRSEGPEVPAGLRGVLYRIAQELVRGEHVAVRGTISILAIDDSVRLSVPVRDAGLAAERVDLLVRTLRGATATEAADGPAVLTVSIPLGPWRDVSVPTVG